MNAWMNSPGHKPNIVKRAYREVGIGIRLGVPSDEGVGGRSPRTSASSCSPRPRLG